MMGIDKCEVGEEERREGRKEGILLLQDILFPIYYPKSLN